MGKGIPKNGVNKGWFKKGCKFPKRPHISKGHPTYSDPERNRKISESKKGEKHWNWKGGISPRNNRFRQSRDYKTWRMSVFKRDRFACVKCKYKSRGTRPADIQADHIKSFSKFPKLRLSVKNGRTLCIPCHKRTKSYKNNK